MVLDAGEQKMREQEGAEDLPSMIALCAGPVERKALGLT